MSFFQKYRLWIAGIILVIAGIGLLTFGYQKLNPVPEHTQFKTNFFVFTYPRVFIAKEYAPGVVSIGNKTKDGIDPLIEVTRYQSDPDTALPANFDAFIKRQAAALCGADGSTESITCTEVGVTPFTSPKGVIGKKLNLTLVKKNLRTATTSSSTYGPFYVFDTSVPAASSTPENPFRFSAIFIYPSLSSYLQGTTSPMVMQEIVDSFELAK